MLWLFSLLSENPRREINKLISEVRQSRQRGSLGRARGREMMEKIRVCLVIFIIRGMGLLSSAIMSNINPHFRKFDSNYTALEGKLPPVLFSLS